MEDSEKTARGVAGGSARGAIIASNIMGGPARGTASVAIGGTAIGALTGGGGGKTGRVAEKRESGVVGRIENGVAKGGGNCPL